MPSGREGGCKPPSIGTARTCPEAMITTRLVDAISPPMLLNSLRSNKIDRNLLITHRFKLLHLLDAYETFSQAADSRALKVIIEA
jgi:alcohol dehydrogenase